MERARHRKSKNHSSIEGNWNSCSGNRQISERTSSKVAYDPLSSKVHATTEDMCKFDSGRNSSKRVCAVPIKKLMAEEMEKEVEVKRRSTSVIARLMGFDGPSSPRTIHRQSKTHSDNYQQSTTKTSSLRNAQHFRVQSNCKSSLEHQEFKDVYEDLEASHAANHHFTSRRKTNSKFVKPMPAFSEQSFMDAKYVSNNGRLCRSNELFDTLEMFDSDNELPPKFLHHPDSFSEMHREGHPSSSLHSHIALLKPAYFRKSEGNSAGWESDRQAIHKHRDNSYWKREDGLLVCSHDHEDAQESTKASKAESKGDDSNSIPTRIVVLKPNAIKMRNTSKSVPSPSFSHDDTLACRNLKEYSNISTQEIESWNSRSRSQEAKEIAKEITRKMRESFSRRPINLLSSGVRGYAGDESSCFMSGRASVTDSEALTVASRPSIDLNNWERPSSSGSTMSSVSVEAKRRLSERWKMTHQNENMGAVHKGSTLGEMLAIPDGEVSDNLDDLMYVKGENSRRAKSDGVLDLDSPLGISSRDGWKNGCVTSSYRSRSLPPSLDRGNQRKSTSEAPFNDIFVMTKESSVSCRSKIVKGSLDTKKNNLSKRLRSVHTNSHSSRYTYGNSGTITSDAHLSEIQDVCNFDEKDPFEEQKSASSNLGDCSSSVCEPEDSTWQEPSAGFSEEGSMLPQCTAPESESSESCKMADHPSPVSVLEVPCAEDVSTSSECFQRVGADLHELRMQLHLLKMDSEAYCEVPVHSFGDADVGKGSYIISEEKDITIPGSAGFFMDENWELSYLFDVVMNSGLDYMNPDTFITTWHSSESPFGPWIFNDLEKKYCDELAGLQVERKLLFDRINSAMLELCQQCTDPCPWMKPTIIRFQPKVPQDGLIDELYKQLVDQEKNADTILSEKVLDRELLWLDFQEYAEVIGKEIEKTMIDELVKEVIISI